MKEGTDIRAPERKKDHIELAFQSQMGRESLDSRFSYEPMLSGHPDPDHPTSFSFLGQSMNSPMWVSSMTGGTALARRINQNLARACKEYGMGMGLGSCRSILFEDTYFDDFNVRPIIGPDMPLFANLGIAQVEQLLKTGELAAIDGMLERLEANGLIVHVNPFQEWLQPEGDFISYPPILTIRRLLDQATYPIIVKEVGQGMGYHSLKALFELPLAAIEFAAHGGTNFAMLELLRASEQTMERYKALSQIGHSAYEMVQLTNQIQAELGEAIQCQQVIISGGVKNFLDGYYLIEQCQLPAVYGQASAFLRHAKESYDALQSYIEGQIRGYQLASAFLKVR